MYRIIILIFIIGIYSCINKNKGIERSQDVTAYTADELYERLEKMSPNNLDSFFCEWNKIEPNKNEIYKQNDTLKAIYAIYKEFYRPFKLLDLGEPEWGNNLNANCKYAVIQNKILYNIVSENDMEEPWKHTMKFDSIIDFKPSVNINKDSVLYLTDNYRKALELFLGKKHSEVGENNIMNTAEPKDKSRDKYEILRKYIPILVGHWGGYWHIETHPYVFYILLNDEINKVYVNFRIGYQGGKAILQKKGEEWYLEKSHLTWIE